MCKFSSIRFHFDQKRHCSYYCPFSELFDCRPLNVCIRCSYSRCFPTFACPSLHSLQQRLVVAELKHRLCNRPGSAGNTKIKPASSGQFELNPSSSRHTFFCCLFFLILAEIHALLKFSLVQVLVISFSLGSLQHLVFRCLEWQCTHPIFRFNTRKSFFKSVLSAQRSCVCQRPLIFVCCDCEVFVNPV